MLAPPRLVARASDTDQDVAEMLEAVKMLRRIAAEPPLAEVIAEELRPGPAVQEDADLIADFRARSGTVYHPSCTARMGPEPAQAVVDARLRVHGLESLRIIDASVFPTVTSGNTNAPTVMVAEKGAAMLIEDMGS
jgi:choline dehydrogenase